MLSNRLVAFGTTSRERDTRLPYQGDTHMHAHKSRSINAISRKIPLGWLVAMCYDTSKPVSAVRWNTSGGMPAEVFLLTVLD